MTSRMYFKCTKVNVCHSGFCQTLENVDYGIFFFHKGLEFLVSPGLEMRFKLR